MFRFYRQKISSACQVGSSNPLVKFRGYKDLELLCDLSPSEDEDNLRIQCRYGALIRLSGGARL